MPVRKTPLITNQYYHIYNRSINKIPVFNNRRDCQRFIDLIDYYQFLNRPSSFSVFKKKNMEARAGILAKLYRENQKLVIINCYCVMPNHFHFLLQQKVDKGVITFIANLQNSYAKYFNIKSQRSGFLFQGRFQAVLIEDNNQLLHLSRYIHLNPFSSSVVEKKDDLINYPWSSLGGYLSNRSTFYEKELILSQYQNTKEYLHFVLDRADYQKRLNEIKHLLLE